VRSGNYSLSADGAGGPCFGYANNESTWVENPAYFDMSNYSQYTVSYWVWYSIEPTYDYFNWYFDNDDGYGWQPNGHFTGPSGGWVKKQLSFPNSNHRYDRVKMKFEFISDHVNTMTGVYVDDIEITGTALQPNLTWATPSGWSGPIVPSMSLGTHTTGTLYAGQTTYIDWGIQNNGLGSAANTFNVDFYIDATWIGSRTIFGLGAGAVDAADMVDVPYTVATPGTYTLKMVIDSNNEVTETNETDNVYEQAFTWVSPPGLPDLVIQSILPSSTTPTVGSSIDVTVTIKNQGVAVPGAFWYAGIYKNLSQPPVQGQTPADDYRGNGSNVPGPGATIVNTFTCSYQYAGSWHMYAMADIGGAVQESNEGNNVGGPVTVTWIPGTVTVSGTLAYDDTSYTGATRVNNRPVRCVKVELWDSDAGQNSGPDELLATTITNGSGQFTFPTVANLDEADQGRQDVYVKAYFRSQEGCLGNAAVLMVDASGLPWTFQSGTYQDVANGTVNLGTIKPLDYGRRSALNIYDAILRGYDWAIARGGTPAHPWYVKVQWQQNIETRTFYSYEDTTILIAGATSTAQGDLRPNEWDNVAIYHEYGHHLAQLFGFDDPDVGGTHTPQTQSLCNNAPCGPLAWAEGCSHFLSCVIQNPVSSVRRNMETNAGWTSTHVYEMDVETGILTYDGGSIGVVNDQGWTWETPVAGTLWDIYDSVNDNQNGDACVDSLSDGLTRSWDVLSNHPGQTITHIGEFYTLYCQRYGGDATTSRLLGKVFCEHGMTTSGCGIVSVYDGSDEHLPLALSCSPNPAHARATLAFSLPGGTDGVRLRIYDVAGRLVQDLLDQPLAAGRHVIIWDGRGPDGIAVHSGLYFCRLTTPSGTKTASVLMVR
jgi:hypothetical protein